MRPTYSKRDVNLQFKNWDFNFSDSLIFGVIKAVVKFYYFKE